MPGTGMAVCQMAVCQMDASPTHRSGPQVSREAGCDEANDLSITHSFAQRLPDKQDDKPLVQPCKPRADLHRGEGGAGRICMCVWEGEGEEAGGTNARYNAKDGNQVQSTAAAEQPDEVEGCWDAR